MNARAARHYEGGTDPLDARLDALRRMALAGYPVGLTVAPILPLPGWEDAYDGLLRDAADALSGVPDLDLTAELITHRFTPNSKTVLQGWYPGSDLPLDEAERARKMTKFGTVKYVLPRAQMDAMRETITASVARILPAARVLYWT